MAKKWRMVRLEEDLAEQLQEYADRLFVAYQRSQVDMADVDEPLSLSATIRRLFEFYQRYRQRCRKARIRKRASKPASHQPQT